MTTRSLYDIIALFIISYIEKSGGILLFLQEIARKEIYFIKKSRPVSLKPVGCF